MVVKYALAGSLFAVLLAGCTPPSAEEQTTSDLSDFLDEPSILKVGECWGLVDELQFDAAPCESPHVFEVVGVIHDWPYEQYRGSLKRRIAGDDAKMEACNAHGARYFGYDYGEKGILVDHDEPIYAGHPEVVVCSASGGPLLTQRPPQKNLPGSYADRGLR